MEEAFRINQRKSRKARNDVAVRSSIYLDIQFDF
jgi:hypothetical protein